MHDRTRGVLSLLSVALGLTLAGPARAQSDYTHPYYWQTLAGVSSFGFRDGVGPAAQFAHPYAVAVTPSGTIYVADTTNCVIRKIAVGGAVTTLAGQPGVPGFADGSGAAAQFAYPCGLALDASGNLFVANNSGNNITEYAPPYTGAPIATISNSVNVPFGLAFGP